MAEASKSKTAAKKSMGPKRRGKKQYAMVSFELDQFEGEFTLPKLDTLPFGVASALQSGNGGKLVSFLSEYAPDSAEAVEDLGGEEVEDFMKAWGKASGTSLGE
ncbi:MAG: hypothetical protein L0J94_03300 [Corynebacterium flavescens]|nr:hypothetical protein [Corynebacterium flavescens]